ncbi:hypothetical protein [Promicromonospora sp. NPDC023805]|uniref:hypothetical protein n=1 Tax=Promicromonospora sp. NPDC023805 TaxID=3154696 RepID=UPI0033EA8996
MQQSNKSRTAVMAGLIALTVTLTTACSSRSDVTVAQLQERSEQIGQSLTATIDGVARYQDDYAGGELRWENAEVNDEDPTGWRYWQWDASIELAADAELTPEQAAERMTKVLEEDGWTADEPRGGVEKAQHGFRKSDDLGEGWYVELAFMIKEPPAPQNLSVSVVSPSTNRS